MRKKYMLYFTLISSLAGGFCQNSGGFSVLTAAPLKPPTLPALTQNQLGITVPT